VILSVSDIEMFAVLDGTLVLSTNSAADITPRFDGVELVTKQHAAAAAAIASAVT